VKSVELPHCEIFVNFGWIVLVVRARRRSPRQGPPTLCRFAESVRVGHILCKSIVMCSPVVNFGFPVIIAQGLIQVNRYGTIPE